MPLQRVRVPSCLQPCRIPLCKCVTAFLPTHLLMGTWAVVSNTAMNGGAQIVFLISVSGILGYLPRSGIAGSKGSDILIS